VTAEFRLALRWLLRDLAAGELTVMAVALVVAVAAMSSVGFFTGRVQSALVGDANQLLAADLVVNADSRFLNYFPRKQRAWACGERRRRRSRP